MFQNLITCTSVANAAKLRRLISTRFGVPIKALLAQNDISQGGAVPTVFFDAVIAHQEKYKHRPAEDHRLLEAWEADRDLRDLRNRVEPFLAGYDVGRRAR